MKQVIVFGSFDPLHEGHRDFFRQAKALGNHLTVVVAHDEALRAHKRREVFQPAADRLAAVAAEKEVDVALIGNAQANRYTLLSELDFDIVALGYDQAPPDEVVRAELDQRGKHHVQIVRLKPHKPDVFKSTLLRNPKANDQVFDLHLHSTASDGDVSPAEVMREAKRRGLSGLALTDHNGLWGMDEAKAAAHELSLRFIEGIEITARYQEADVHILGYSRAFQRAVLRDGLAETRRGYEKRTQAMVHLCQKAGYDKVLWENITARRANFTEPCYVSFDVAREVSAQYHLDPETARKMTVTGGVCHVPYGEWALSPAAAVKLIHQAAGVASLAHPGTIEYEHSRELLLTILEELLPAKLDAIEVVHPFHDTAYQAWLTQLTQEHGLAITGGSDWHGPDHLPENDAAFGKLGVSAFPLL